MSLFIRLRRVYWFRELLLGIFSIKIEPMWRYSILRSILRFYERSLFTVQWIKWGNYKEKIDVSGMCIKGKNEYR